MENQIVIVDAEAKHLRVLAENLRTEDVREITSYGYSVKKALWRSWRGSLVSKVIFVDGEIAAFFGVGGGALDEIGVPFLLTTPACEKVSALKFARIYQTEVMKMLKIFPVLENHVHAVYDKAVKLLQNIGFTFSDPEAFGEHGELFRKFRMTAA